MWSKTVNTAICVGIFPFVFGQGFFEMKLASSFCWHVELKMSWGARASLGEASNWPENVLLKGNPYREISFSWTLGFLFERPGRSPQKQYPNLWFWWNSLELFFHQLQIEKHSYFNIFILHPVTFRFFSCSFLKAVQQTAFFSLGDNIKWTVVQLPWEKKQGSNWIADFVCVVAGKQS